MKYNTLQIEVKQTAEFATWFETLKDVSTKARIDIRIRRLSQGYWGDTKFIDQGVLELRLHVGPGYRLYFVQRGDSLILLLCGGTKAHQQRDIQKAITMAKAL